MSRASPHRSWRSTVQVRRSSGNLHTQAQRVLTFAVSVPEGPQEAQKGAELLGERWRQEWDWASRPGPGVSWAPSYLSTVLSVGLTSRPEVLYIPENNYLSPYDSVFSSLFTSTGQF